MDRFPVQAVDRARRLLVVDDDEDCRAAFVSAHALLGAVAHCFGTTSPETSLPLPGVVPIGPTAGPST